MVRRSVSHAGLLVTPAPESTEWSHSRNVSHSMSHTHNASRHSQSYSQLAPCGELEDLAAAVDGHGHPFATSTLHYVPTASVSASGRDSATSLLANDSTQLQFAPASRASAVCSRRTSTGGASAAAAVQVQVQ